MRNTEATIAEIISNHQWKQELHVVTSLFTNNIGILPIGENAEMMNGNGCYQKMKILF